MPQFIRCHDIKENSKVIINKDKIQEIRVKENKYKGHPEHLEIKFCNGNSIEVAMLIENEVEGNAVFFNINQR
ncbi:hypothetical protein Geu3261_0240_002 [Komagataeibacter europaeus NBRC 3261]|uniref:Uncharacterized protein n=1 Tax=Komagataeibacter europaeus NBRC 3261 TaxID=1234669 RepID=A0A0D6Q2F8_KOMEU|nr:hypothetical protein [Komagataeibacter europaeus]GAN97727.1 hypothetical protein Geu3261_0240_002 [Komagataeibacter europaeus NBRC 3261]